jgi:hypothetical protein
VKSRKQAIANGLSEAGAKNFRIATKRRAIPSAPRELLVPHESLNRATTRRTKSSAVSELCMIQVVFPEPIRMGPHGMRM